LKVLVETNALDETRESIVQDQETSEAAASAEDIVHKDEILPEIEEKAEPRRVSFQDFMKQLSTTSQIVAASVPSPVHEAPDTASAITDLEHKESPKAILDEPEPPSRPSSVEPARISLNSSSIKALADSLIANPIKAQSVPSSPVSSAVQDPRLRQPSAFELGTSSTSLVAEVSEIPKIEQEVTVMDNVVSDFRDSRRERRESEPNYNSMIKDTPSPPERGFSASSYRDSFPPNRSHHRGPPANWSTPGLRNEDPDDGLSPTFQRQRLPREGHPLYREPVRDGVPFGREGPRDPVRRDWYPPRDRGRPGYYHRPDGPPYDRYPGREDRDRGYPVGPPSDRDRNYPPPGPDRDRNYPPPGPLDRDRNYPPPGPERDRNYPPPGPLDRDRNYPPPGPLDRDRNYPPDSRDYPRWDRPHYNSYRGRGSDRGRGR
jgi:hypothetical protein